MSFIVILVATAAAVMLCRNAIKRWPVAFYALAVVFDVLLLLMTAGDLPQWSVQPLTMLMRRGGIGVALFLVVMYIGVLPRGSKLSHWLRPIRAELSIMACLFILGHMCAYGAVYLPMVFAGTVRSSLLPGLLVAFVLGLLVLVLGVTSLRAVKRHMKARSWKHLQNWAYLFYLLIFVHVGLMIGPSALAGNEPALTNFIIYAVVFVSYIVLRIIRAVADRRDRIDLAKTVADQGFQA